ncbi:uncharacterized protein LOC135101056 [Scylla paramamosain]|uniref:uncharacterized protein LOC135101056 n=1 Tax=Scylla paramamosain TaxID=85552 RepID=UPI0030829617
MVPLLELASDYNYFHPETTVLARSILSLNWVHMPMGPSKCAYIPSLGNAGFISIQILSVTLCLERFLSWIQRAKGEAWHRKNVRHSKKDEKDKAFDILLHASTEEAQAESLCEDKPRPQTRRLKKKQEKLHRSSSVILRQSPTHSQLSFLHREPISFSLCPVKHIPDQAPHASSPDNYFPKLRYVPYSSLSTSPSPPTPRCILSTPPSSPEQSTFPFPERLPSHSTVKHTTALSHTNILFRRQRTTHQSFRDTTRKAQPLSRIRPSLQQQSTIHMEKHPSLSSSSSCSLSKHRSSSPEHSSSESSAPIVRSLQRNLPKPSKQLPSARSFSPPFDSLSFPAESQPVSSISPRGSSPPISPDVSLCPRHPSQRKIPPSSPDVPAWPLSPLPPRRPPSPVQTMTWMVVTAEVH